MGWNIDHFVVQVCNTTVTVKIVVNQEIQEEAISSSCNYCLLLPHTGYATGPHQLVGAHAPTNWLGPITHEQEAEPTWAAHVL